MKHKVYLTHSISSLLDPELISEVETFNEAWCAIDDFLAKHKFHKERYCRYLLDPDTTFIDFGSYCSFIAITPPFTRSEMFGDS